MNEKWNSHPPPRTDTSIMRVAVRTATTLGALTALVLLGIAKYNGSIDGNGCTLGILGVIYISFSVLYWMRRSTPENNTPTRINGGTWREAHNGRRRH